MKLGKRINPDVRAETRDIIIHTIHYFEHNIVKKSDFYKIQDMYGNILRDLKPYVTAHNDILKEKTDHREYIIQR